MRQILLYFLNLIIAVAMVSCSGHEDDMDDNGNGGGGGTTPETLAVITGTPTEITKSSVKIPVEVKGKNILARGVCYSIATNPTVDGSKTNEETTSGSITSSITNLASGTTYYVRGYATNNNETIYGEEKQFTTKEEIQPETGIKIATLPVKNITETTAISGGNITDDGGSPLIEKGICWSTTVKPTVKDFKTTDSPETGVYNSEMTELSEGTTYYVRSYATNNKGTTYGQQIEFKTIGVIPILETSDVTSITGNTAKSGGSISKQGGIISSVGICWSLTENPTIENSKNEIPYESDSFELQLSNLEPLRTYYVRSYAKNDTGIGYGENRSFTTLNDGTIISFEDKEFETYCLKNFDSNKDNFISIDEVNKITEIDISEKSISAIPEIQYFTSLMTLNCKKNQLTSLDVSKCTSLQELYCYSNQLISLDVSGCTSLKKLDCSGNKLSSLDVSGYTNLRGLVCDNNRLTSLDMSGCTSLTALDCRNNPMTSLDMSGCTSLIEFYYNNSPVTHLNMSECTNLKLLYCYSNQLISLDVSGCTSLRTLYCNGNQLISLDVSGCTSLRSLHCYSNQLTFLNVNGCMNLYRLRCESNQLTSLDVSECADLHELHCEHNQLISLDVSRCTNLIELFCWDNPNLVTVYLKNGQSAFVGKDNFTQIVYK